jgi:hypothetical protein
MQSNTTTSWANGDRYEGQWSDDKRHGRGQFTCAQDGTTYDGEFVLNRKEGRGSLRFPNGHTLTGVWGNGELKQVENFVFANDSPWKNPAL